MTKADQIKALYRSNFSAFLKFAFRELNPKTDLVDTWHIDVLADYLERVAKGEIGVRPVPTATGQQHHAIHWIATDAFFSVHTGEIAEQHGGWF